MNKHQKRFLRAVALMACVGVAVCAFCFSRFVPVGTRHHLEHVVADARSLAAMARYLVEPELPGSQSGSMELLSCYTNLPHGGQSSRRTLSNTNLASLTISNGEVCARTNPAAHT